MEKKSVYLWRQSSSSVKTWCANSAKSCIQLVSTHSAESYASYAARTYRDVDDTARNGNGRVINLATICARACRFVISRSDFTPAIGNIYIHRAVRPTRYTHIHLYTIYSAHSTGGFARKEKVKK